jgi:eukaryotic-like serine/threonine-protein kinase
MAETDTLIGHQVGRYVIQSQLREDRLGRVYLAHELPGKKLVDVKVLDPSLARDYEMFGRFGRELLATATINHPNSVQMLDFGDHRGLFHYLVLEHLEAYTLEDELREKKQLAWERVVRIAHQVAGALEAAHKEKIIHRALCPANLLLLQNADGDFVKIRDFGLSRLVDPDDPDAPNLTAAGTRVGTAEYMAPEYISAAIVHGRGDLYALGICMYEMLVGKPPFTGMTVEVMDQQLNHEAPRVSESVKVPAWLDDLVARLLTKDMDGRPKDAGGVVAALEKGLGAPIELPEVSAAVPGKPEKKTPSVAADHTMTKVALAAGVAVIVLVCIATALMVGLLLLGAS